MTDAKEIIAKVVRDLRKSDRFSPEIADAILAALEENGMVVVPKEPSEKMVADGLIGLVTHICENTKLDAVEDGQELTEQQMAFRYMTLGARMRDGKEIEACWSAMISARPAGAVKEG